MSLTIAFIIHSTTMAAQYSLQLKLKYKDAVEPLKPFVVAQGNASIAAANASKYLEDTEPSIVVLEWNLGNSGSPDPTFDLGFFKHYHGIRFLLTTTTPVDQDAVAPYAALNNVNVGMVTIAGEPNTGPNNGLKELVATVDELRAPPSLQNKLSPLVPKDAGKSLILDTPPKGKPDPLVVIAQEGGGIDVDSGNAEKEEVAASPRTHVGGAGVGENDDHGAK